jgi:hypothetical protein
MNTIQPKQKFREMASLINCSLIHGEPKDFKRLKF